MLQCLDVCGNIGTYVTQEIFQSYDLEDLGAISSHKMREAISAAGDEQINTGNIMTWSKWLWTVKVGTI